MNRLFTTTSRFARNITGKANITAKQYNCGYATISLVLQRKTNKKDTQSSAFFVSFFIFHSSFSSGKGHAPSQSTPQVQTGSSSSPTGASSVVS